MSSESKYITKLNKNNAGIYNYTGVYYFLSERGNDRWARCHGAFTIIWYNIDYMSLNT